jgi:hypothetical protein
LRRTLGFGHSHRCCGLDRAINFAALFLSRPRHVLFWSFIPVCLAFFVFGGKGDDVYSDCRWGSLVYKGSLAYLFLVVIVFPHISHLVGWLVGGNAGLSVEMAVLVVILCIAQCG